MNQNSIKLALFLLAITLMIPSPALADGHAYRQAGSYFYMGDGKIKIGRGYDSKPEPVTFRNGDGSYDKKGLKKLNDIYGSDFSASETMMSVRLIELLDYLEDHFNGEGIRIISGYRTPERNTTLRNKGGLAASSSLHLDAEAMDLIMNGVSSKKIREYLIAENCCGVGFYHGEAVHIDTGPARHWDETTSGVKKGGGPTQNKFIIIETKSDIYNAGEEAGLKFSRVNEYPFGVKDKMELICKGERKEKKKTIHASFHPDTKKSDGCYSLEDIKEGKNLGVTLPKVGKNELECKIRATFCAPVTPKMPAYVDSNRFVIR